MEKVSVYIILGLLAALLGGLIGGNAALFLHFIEWGQHLLWHQLIDGLPFQTLRLTSLGGC